MNMEQCGLFCSNEEYISNNQSRISIVYMSKFQAILDITSYLWSNSSMLVVKLKINALILPSADRPLLRYMHAFRIMQNVCKWNIICALAYIL